MLGCQQPRILLVPEGEEHPDAVAVLEFAAALGIQLDEWQKLVLTLALRRRLSKWAAFAVAVCAPRQNGKNGISEVRELAGPVLLGERMVIHSAHLADTAKEGFRRLDEIIEANEWLSKDVRHIWRANGHESIEFKGGGRIRFRTRGKKGGGRGFSGDFVLMDEAMILSEPMMGAILPVVSAQPDPQIWYQGSAVDQLVHDEGMVFSRVRSRALTGTDPNLLYMEWSVDAPDPATVDEGILDDPEQLAIANPALGIRIMLDYIEKERAELDDRTFAVERCCIGDWPLVDADLAVINLDLWRSLTDDSSTIEDAPCFALDVSPNRRVSSIGVAGRRKDGRVHAELADERPGTGWVAKRARELQDTHNPVGFVVDGRSPAASLIPELEEAGVRVDKINASEQAEACGVFYDLADQEQLRHLGQPQLLSALKGAAQRPLGDRWAWSRKNSAVNITGLVAVTLAVWGHATLEGRSVYEDRGLVVLGR